MPDYTFLALSAFLSDKVPSSPISKSDCASGQRLYLSKVLFDKTICIILLLLITPAFLIVALAIKLDSKGPILFRQHRQGINDCIFTILKFRTMYDRNDLASLDGSIQATRNDTRTTRVGRWLRRYSIDELPQLINVLMGDMSLVGPRPHALNTQVAGNLFIDVVPHYSQRHRVLPGITGWAQVNGWRGETVVNEQIEQRVAYDLYYIKNWSLAFDLQILWLTIKKEIFNTTAF